MPRALGALRSRRPKTAPRLAAEQASSTTGPWSLLSIRGAPSFYWHHYVWQGGVECYSNYKGTCPPRLICYSHEPRSTLLPTFADVINFIEIHRRQQRHMGDNPPTVCSRPESKHRRSPQPTIPQSSSGRAGPNHLRRPRYHSCRRPCR